MGREEHGLSVPQTPEGIDDRIPFVQNGCSPGRRLTQGTHSSLEDGHLVLQAPDLFLQALVMGLGPAVAHRRLVGLALDLDQRGCVRVSVRCGKGG